MGHCGHDHEDGRKIKDPDSGQDCMTCVSLDSSYTYCSAWVHTYSLSV
jgi:hypothetical protein